MAINLSTLRTPGVYIDEIKKFPPSIAAVETAIPAFIGYTQKALKRGEDLTLKPTLISSMLEYEEFFGSTQQEQNLEVISRNRVTKHLLEWIGLNDNLSDYVVHSVDIRK